jgi:hypothetical protein
MADAFQELLVYTEVNKGQDSRWRQRKGSREMVWLFLILVTTWLALTVVNGWRAHAIERRWKRVLLEQEDWIAVAGSSVINRSMP